MFVTAVKVLGFISTIAWLSSFVVTSIPSTTASSVAHWPVQIFNEMMSEARIYFMDPLESKELYLDNCIYLEYTASDDSMHTKCYEWSRAASKLFSSEDEGGEPHDGYTGESMPFTTTGASIAQLLAEKLPKIFLGVAGSVCGFVSLGYTSRKLRA